MAKIYLGLGSNQDPKDEFLRTAERYIQQFIGDIVNRSSDYETEPWGVKDQPSFLNNVIEVISFHNPHVILSSIEKIEFSMGRVKRRKWGERNIDIDILFYEDLILDSPKLKIPHPFIAERIFVLAPMREINNMFIHPMLKKTIEELYLASLDQSAARIIGE